MSKKSSLFVVITLLVLTATLLSACGGATVAPTVAPTAVKPASKLAVGIVLPTKDEPRWVQDETRFKEALTAAGYDAEILFSQGDSAKEKANVEALITKGVKVIVICPQDGTAAAAAADAARAAGIKVISYDRLIRETDAVDYYVTFDSIAVGAQQAQYLVDNAKGAGNPLYLYAGAASDNNAFIFFEGAWGVLQPKIADGTFVIKNSSEAVGLQAKAKLTRDEQAKIIGQVTTNWDFNTAKNLAEANLTSAKTADKGNVFILAPNDGTARAIADVFGIDKDVKSYLVTGQDAEKASVQYIIDGKQSMTVFKDVRTLVKDAIGAAVALLEGKTPGAKGSYNNGKTDVPAIQSAVVTVDKANVKAALIDSGYYQAADFTGLAGGVAPAPTGKLAVGIVLPTKDEPRWVQDETRFKEALTAAGYDAEILFSQGDSAKEKANVEALITKGVKVIVICPQDGTAAAAAADAARAAGIKVISYDRLIRETDAVDYYVTFDSIAVGAQQAQYLVDNAKGAGNPLYLYAGAASDNNAFIFFEGAWGVLQPKIADGTFVIKNSSEAVGLQAKAKLTRDEQAKIIGQVTTNWDFNTAKNLAEANLTSAKTADKGNVFILAPNDGTARAIADVFGIDKDVKSYLVTGQDAEKASVQYIIDGKQSMTVFKDVRTLVKDAIGAAVALLEGKTPTSKGSYNNGKADVPAIQSAVVTVDKANVKTALIDSGYYQAGDFTGLDAGGAAPPPSSDKGKVEVFSWWTGGGEAAGLDAMIKIFKAQYPNIEFVNAAVAGGAGTNARAVLASRLQAGDPPDSWQGHAGQELIGTYVDGKQIQPLNDLYTAEGWLAVMPKTLIPLISKADSIYSVPVNIHRANVLWYNPKVLTDNKITVPTTVEEWITAMDTLKAAGVQPLALGEQWTKMHLFETVLLGSLGPEKYNGLWSGATDWTGADVTAALANYAKVLTYANTDSASLSWQDASQLVVNGDAAFNVMGDWAEGYFRELGKKPQADYGWAPVPGTVGTFQFLSDSFVLAVGAPDANAATAWLKIAGSKSGQEAFNPVKGSICARTDCDKTLFGEYLQSAMADWASNTVVGSLTHGVVANDSWKSEIDTALGLYIADSKADVFQAALAAACKSSGTCK